MFRLLEIITFAVFIVLCLFVSNKEDRNKKPEMYIAIMVSGVLAVCLLLLDLIQKVHS